MLKHIATIINAHGLDGTLKLKFNNTDYDWFLQKPFCFIHQAHQKPEQAIHVKILKCQSQGKFLLAHFENISTKTEADKWAKGSILLPNQELPALQKNEYYIDDLIGLAVMSQDSPYHFGTIHAILNATTGEFLEIIQNDKAVPILIPFQSHFVHHVDLQNKQLFITGLDDFFTEIV